MYFKGCENSKTFETAEEKKHFDDEVLRLFGYYDDDGRKMEWIDGEWKENESKRKKMKFDEFLGKMIEDKDTDGKKYFDGKDWVSRDKFYADKPRLKQAFIYAMDHPNPIEVIRQDPKTMKVEKFINKTKIYR